MARKKTKTLFKLEPRKSPPKFQLVDFERLIVPPDEEPLDQDFVRDLAGKIHFANLTTPLIVRPQGQNFLVLDGRRRHSSLSLLREGGLNWHNGDKAVELPPQVSRFKHIPVVVMKDLPRGNAVNAIIALMQNEMRRANVVNDLDHLLTLHEEGYDEKAIYRRTGMPIAKQRKRMKLAKLSAQMRRALRDGILGVNKADRVANLSKPQQGQVWANYKRRVDEAEGPTPDRIIDADITAVLRVQVQEAMAFIPSEALAPHPNNTMFDGAKIVEHSENFQRLLTASLALRRNKIGSISKPDKETKITVPESAWNSFTEALKPFEEQP